MRDAEFLISYSPKIVEATLWGKGRILVSKDVLVEMNVAISGAALTVDGKEIHF